MLVLNSNKIQSSQYLITRTNKKKINLAVTFATVSARISLHSLKLLVQDHSFFLGKESTE